MKLRKSDYDKFVAAFRKHYKTQIKQDREPTEAEMLSLYSVFKSDKYGREVCGEKHSKRKKNEISEIRVMDSVHRWFDQVERQA